MKQIDHVLIIGFGAPGKRDEVWPFLKEVTKGRKVPEERLREVERHYEAIGGGSPYNEQVFNFRTALEKALRVAGFHLPVFAGMRHWHPFLTETLLEARSRSLKRGLAVILAPHRSAASYGRYVDQLGNALRQVASTGLDYEFLKPWFRHRLFVNAHVEAISAVIDCSSADLLRQSLILFTAHSIPLQDAMTSQYAEELTASSHLVADQAGFENWDLGYQSRSGSPENPWLEPELAKVIERYRGSGLQRVVVVPIGFLCENAEILFDLDVELRQSIREAGLAYARAGTVLCRAPFVEMIVDLIRREQFEPSRFRPSLSKA